MSSSRKFVGGALVGLVVGFVAGILLAPKSGQETRDEIKQRTKRMWGDARDQAVKMQEQLGSRVDKLKQVAGELGGQAKEESRALLARADTMKTKLREFTQVVAEGNRRTKNEAMTSAKQLAKEGSGLIKELELATKRLMSEAKAKIKPSDPETDGEAVARLQELERNAETED